MQQCLHLCTWLLGVRAVKLNCLNTAYTTGVGPTIYHLSNPTRLYPKVMNSLSIFECFAGHGWSCSDVNAHFARGASEISALRYQDVGSDVKIQTCTRGRFVLPSISESMTEKELEQCWKGQPSGCGNCENRRLFCHT